MKILSAFDGGNIRSLGIDGDNADLEIRSDAHSEAFQWFYFRVAEAKGRTLHLALKNCARAFVPKGWDGYQARYSYDRVNWYQASTSYLDGTLTITLACERDLVWFAYFAPYTIEDHNALIARMSQRPGVRYAQLGTSVEGQPMDCLRWGDGPKQVWFYARQHPGETMAEHWMEGALEFLTSPSSADAATVELLRSHCTLHMIPNMNPDGSCRGHLRTNALGVDLNRQWAEPNIEKSPEVLCVRNEMDRTRVHYAIDVHGDEEIPACFLASYDEDSDAGRMFREFRAALCAQSRDFQDKLGYPSTPPEKANLGISTNQIATRFPGALAMTLEMPFKDHDANADARTGFSPARAKALAHDILRVLAKTVSRP
jgi:murein tripeptide amidase MpaA